jgi:pyrroline-5-carboxylate reductase
MKIGFLGAGRMATALAMGFINNNLVKPEEISASDPIEETQKKFHEKTQSAAYSNNKKLIEEADILILAVKPQQVKEVLEKVGNSFAGKLLLSIAAGITISKLESLVHESTRVIRIMPNTPLEVGAGASAFSLGKNATSEDGEIVKKFFSALGVAEEVPEKWLDAVTGLSGSGPAYFYLVAAAIAEASVTKGLEDVHKARRLAAQTLIGAGKMMLKDINRTPDELIREVMSPRGTTEEAFKILNQYNVRNIFIEAVEAAIRRSRELSSEA